MKKIIILSLIFIFMLSFLFFPAFASEGASGATEGTPFTQTIADFVTKNADTLLGVLTLLGSLLVAFFYKIGLLPMLKSGLSALADMLNKTTAITEEFTDHARKSLLCIEEYTAPVLAATQRSEEEIRKLTAHINTLEEALSQSEKERKKTAAVLTTETALFYELLSSVNLPEAQKDSMSESYYRMKKLLEEEA